MRVQDGQNIINDLLFGLREKIGRRKHSFRDTGPWALLAELGDDVIQILFGAETFPLQDFDERRNLLHVENRGFLQGHAFPFRPVIHNALLRS